MTGQRQSWGDRVVEVVAVLVIIVMLGVLGLMLKPIVENLQAWVADNLPPMSNDSSGASLVVEQCFRAIEVRDPRSYRDSFESSTEIPAELEPGEIGRFVNVRYQVLDLVSTSRRLSSPNGPYTIDEPISAKVRITGEWRSYQSDKRIIIDTTVVVVRTRRNLISQSYVDIPLSIPVWLIHRDNARSLPFDFGSIDSP